MSTTAKVVLTVVGVIVGFWLVSLIFKLVIGAFLGLLTLVAPILIIGTIGYLGYVFVTKKALGGSGRRSLP